LKRVLSGEALCVKRRNLIKIKEDEMGGEYRKYWRDEKSMQNFSRKTQTGELGIDIRTTMKFMLNE
jgi:hypothetical protein